MYFKGQPFSAIRYNYFCSRELPQKLQANCIDIPHHRLIISLKYDTRVSMTLNRKRFGIYLSSLMSFAINHQSYYDYQKYSLRHLCWNWPHMSCSYNCICNIIIFPLVVYHESSVAHFCGICFAALSYFIEYSESS